MKYITLLLAFVGLISLTGCQESYTAELAITPATPEDALKITPFDVMRRIDRIAGNMGLKPYTPPRVEDDLLDMADSDDLTGQMTSSNKASKAYKHPQFELYMTATRHTGEVVVLLNMPVEKPTKTELKLYVLLKDELTKKLPETAGLKVVEAK